MDKPSRTQEIDAAILGLAAVGLRAPGTNAALLATWRQTYINKRVRALHRSGMLHPSTAAVPVWFTTAAAAARASAKEPKRLSTDEMRAEIMRLATAKTGFTYSDLRSESPQRTQRLLHTMVKAGTLWPGRAGHRTVRFFASIADAAAFEGKSVISGTVVRDRSQRLPDDAPVVWPTNADGTPAWRVTCAPALPDPSPNRTPCRPSAQAGRSIF